MVLTLVFGNSTHRLRQRNVQAKRNLALREFALGPRASNAPL